jgi:hypothetical protein
VVVAIPSDWRMPPHPLALADATRPPCRSKVAAFRCSPLRSLSADCGRSGQLVGEPRGGGTARVEKECDQNELDARNWSRRDTGELGRHSTLFVVTDTAVIGMADAGHDRVELVNGETSEGAGLSQANAFEQRAPDPFTICIAQLDEGISEQRSGA